MENTATFQSWLHPAWLCVRLDQGFHFSELQSPVTGSAPTLEGWSKPAGMRRWCLQPDLGTAWPRQWPAQRQGHRPGDLQKTPNHAGQARSVVAWLTIKMMRERTPRCARTSGSPGGEDSVGGGLAGKWGTGERRQELPGGFQRGQGPQAGLQLSTLARYSNQEISLRMEGGAVRLAGGTGTSPPPPPAHSKWSLYLVSGSGLLFCQDPGFPAPARSFPFDF